MKCDDIRGKIYTWVYSDVHKLDDEQIQHITDCPNCKAYYQDCHRANRITTLLSQKKPTLENPQKLSSDILDSIDELEPKEIRVRFRLFNVSKRILAAASVCLIIVFGYEQYIITDKMIKLEEQMSAVKATTVNSSQLKEILRYYPSHGIESLKSTLASSLKDSQDKSFKSAVLLAGYSVLSHDDVKKLLHEYLAQAKSPSEDSSVVNKKEKE